MRKSIRRSSPQFLIAVVVNILMILICVIISYLILNKIQTDYELDIKNVKEQMESQKIFAYEAKGDIQAGQIITEEDLNYHEIYSSQGEEYYITKDHLGMVSKINIKEGTYLLDDMLVKDQKVSNLREIEYNIFFPNSNLNEADYVDVRILFPNGEDFIILSKKNIKNLNKETGNCYLWLSEREILDMAGAVVDTYVFPGSKIYTTRYLEPELQEASVINYKPNLATLELMQKNTNILKNITELDEILFKPEVHQDNQRFRRELEFRLNDFYDNTDQNYDRPIDGIGGYKEEVVEYGG